MIHERQTLSDRRARRTSFRPRVRPINAEGQRRQAAENTNLCFVLWPLCAFAPLRLCVNKERRCTPIIAAIQAEQMPEPWLKSNRRALLLGMIVPVALTLLAGIGLIW